jgi:hypothetical protein
VTIHRTISSQQHTCGVPDFFPPYPVELWRQHAPPRTTLALLHVSEFTRVAQRVALDLGNDARAHNVQACTSRYASTAAAQCPLHQGDIRASGDQPPDREASAAQLRGHRAIVACRCGLLRRQVPQLRQGLPAAGGAEGAAAGSNCGATARQQGLVHVSMPQGGSFHHAGCLLGSCSLWAAALSRCCSWLLDMGRGYGFCSWLFGVCGLSSQHERMSTCESGQPWLMSRGFGHKSW